ncbi:MAG: hypothetical protein JJU45_18515 [Acidimicrobiia bacterium]|nr:hypothetical protein [Acidimicrobiia bacterium]
MNNAIFLLAAVGASILGSLVLWLRQRKPRTVMSSIEEFQQEMDALKSDRPGVTPRPSARRGDRRGSSHDDRPAEGDGRSHDERRAD